MRTRLAVASLLAAVTASTIATLLGIANGDWIPALIISLWLISIASIGALVAIRMPGVVIGPLMLAIGLITTVQMLASSYVEYVFEGGRSSLPGGLLAGWLSLWLTVPGIGLFAFLFLRFPDGNLLSPRWRSAEWVAALGITCGSVGLMFRPGPIDYAPSIDNPLGIEGIRGLAGFVDGAGTFMLGIVVIATIVSLVIRFRRSHGIQRRQLKSFVFAVSLFPPIFILANFIGDLETSEDEYINFFMMIGAAFLIPIGLGVSILKYRLYDIDVIINRALVYGSLTALVVAFYLGTVFALQIVLDPVTRDSGVAVAASTLAAAALVRPLRARMQAFIDRRFYRRKYDAARTLVEFGTRLRDEVELDVVSGDVVRVVAETVQPRHVSLWVRPGGTR